MAYIIPTIHCANVLHGGAPITSEIAADLSKAKRISEEGITCPENICAVLPWNPSGLDTAYQTAMAWMAHWEKEGARLGVDVETSSLHYFDCKLYSIAIAEADPSNVAVSFPFWDLNLLPEAYERGLTWQLRRLLASPNVEKVYHNAPFDMGVLARKGFQINGKTWDTLGLHHAYQPDIPHDLGWVGHTFLDVGPWKLAHDSSKMANTNDPAELIVYNAKDALYTAQLVEPLLDVLHKRGTSKALLEWLPAFTELATDMELAGLPVNMEKRRAMGVELLRDIHCNRNWIRDYLKWPDFNINSDDHKREALFGKKYSQAPWNHDIESTKLTEKTKLPSTSYKAIIDHMEHPFVLKLVSCIEDAAMYAGQYKEAPDLEIWKLRQLGLNNEADKYKPGRVSAYEEAISNDGRLHPKWNPYGQTGSRYTSSPNCFDAKTELMTVEGWIPFPQARKRNIQPIQYCRDSKISSLPNEWTYIDRVLRKGSRTITICNRQIDIRTTPDHNLLIRHKIQRGRKKVWVDEILQADDIATRSLNGPTIPKTGGTWLPENHISLDPEWITLLCACQADGWRRKYGNGEAWSFYFSKERKTKRLADALRKIGGAVNWYEIPLPRKSGKPQTAIYIKESPAKEWIDNLLGPQKEFGPWLLGLGTETLRQFCYEVTQWDGRSDRASEYSSTIKGNVDWVQIAAAISGERVGNVREFWGNRSKKPCYQMGQGPSKGRAGYHRKKDTRISTIARREKFYCVTVPDSFIFIRRNGKITIVGNCQNQKETHRRFIEPVDGRVIICSDKDQLELRLLAVRAGIVPLLKEMRIPGGDPHSTSAGRVYGPSFFEKTGDDRKNTRAVVKNVMYAGGYLAGWETVWRTCRENKRIDAILRAVMTKKAVQKVHRDLFKKHYAGIYRWHEENLIKLKHDGYMKIPPLGRKRYCPVFPAPATEFANYSIQSVAGDIVAMEMCRINWELKRRYKGTAYIIKHGHDEVAVECNARDTEGVMAIVKHFFGSTPFEGPAGPVNLTADVNWGRDLYLAKGD